MKKKEPQKKTDEMGMLAQEAQKAKQSKMRLDNVAIMNEKIDWLVQNCQELACPIEKTEKKTLTT